MDEQLNYAPCGYISLNDNGTILEVNETFLEMIGYEREDVLEQSINVILAAPSRLFYQIYFVPLIKLHRRVDEMYLLIKSKTGKEIPVLVNGSRQTAQDASVNCCVLVPIRQRYKLEQEMLAAKQAAEEANRVKNEMIIKLEQLRQELEEKQQELLHANAQLEVLAALDGLTGLHNRRSFQEKLAASIRLFQRLKQPLSLILLDIDHFKSINDTFGHAAGDEVIRQIATILKEQCRKSDIAARYGGEEFALILPNIDSTGALAVAERLRLLVEQAEWPHCPVTVSIGAATMMDHDNEASLLLRADQALYASKEEGRNSVTHSSFL